MPYTPLSDLETLPALPRLGEKVLGFLLRQDDREGVIGDFAEECELIAGRCGAGAARRWFWLELLRSMPALIILSHKKLRRNFMKQNNIRLAAIGIILILPALALCVGGILQSGFGLSQFNEAINFDMLFFNPAVLIGGLGLAVGLNLWPVVRIRFQDGNLVGTVKVRDSVANLGLIALISLLTGIIFLYLLAENLQIFAR